ncbi:hypothetical protein [Bacillus sp. C15(2022)]|uniref:hypothetical protein n=1 Tax=Bacillus TaxID=1386 RepID=UPI00330798FA
MEIILLSLQLKYLRDFYNIQEKHNEDLLSSWDVEYEKQLEELGLNEVGKEEEKERFWDYNSQDPYRFEIVHPQIIRKTIFLQAYFTFESYLNSVCDFQKKQLYLNLSYKDMKGQGIERAKLYLCKACGMITDAFSSYEWKIIRDYNTIRNALVHNNGIVDSSKLNSVSQGIILTKQNKEKDKNQCTIEFEREFLDEVFVTLDKFSKELF